MDSLSGKVRVHRLEAHPGLRPDIRAVLRRVQAIHILQGRASRRQAALLPVILQAIRIPQAQAAVRITVQIIRTTILTVPAQAIQTAGATATTIQIHIPIPSQTAAGTA